VIDARAEGDGSPAVFGTVKTRRGVTAVSSSTHDERQPQSVRLFESLRLASLPGSRQIKTQLISEAQSRL
jgi:hypothetical protein